MPALLLERNGVRSEIYTDYAALEFDDQTTQSYCLMLVTNAFVAWNTVYIQAVLDQLLAEGYPVNDDNVRHLAPLMREHINPHGKIQFDMDRINQAVRARVVWHPSDRRDWHHEQEQEGDLLLTLF